MGWAGGNEVSECPSAPHPRPPQVWTEVLPGECTSRKALECSASWRVSQGEGGAVGKALGVQAAELDLNLGCTSWQVCGHWKCAELFELHCLISPILTPLPHYML